ncbi:NADH-quinone oxidoreductase subunit NuoE [Lutispora sp.]|uniref:NADH-quinone oxidoreductase subunit NuoE n=1 Tax=Lutispora sp. TaxID=2828727 RepID=UPI000EE2C15F|nr:NADH-quinone oxidoreductase subunit NuoE [Lutispora sp.]MEA4960502.1 NADH-quinone oxidoreductase subunit NuoE [Lutispora sp.]HCJ58749.1 NADH-quinone oxidoreductase subunit NuoE [Clostridiaceae bacterium]
MNELEMKEKMEKLDRIIENHRDQQGGLMPVLHETQELFGYIPEEAQKRISKELNIPMAEIYGVATFYSRFTLKPRGEHTIGVCLGTACYVKNAQLVFERLQKELKVKPGGTTADNKFTLEATRCLGCCGLAPVMMIGEDVYGKLVPDDIPDILKKYQ